MDQAQLNKIRSAAGLTPVYTRVERDHLAETARQKDAGNSTLAEAANNRAPGTVLAQIARQHLGIRNLKAQNSDERDFHECSVWAIEAALKAAFKAGQSSAPKTVKEGDESAAEAKKAGTDYDPKGGERYPAEDKVDPDVKKEAKAPKKGKSADGYKTPKNKTAKQVTEAKAKKDYDGDGKVESSEDEHKGAKNKALKKAMEKNAETGKSANKAVDAYVKKHGRVPESAIQEMDLDMDMGDEGASDLKQRRMDLIRNAVEKVRGAGDIVDVGDEEMGGDEGGIDWPEEHQTDAEYEDQMMAGEDEMDDEMSGEMDFAGGDADFDEDEEDCGCAMGMAMPEDEEAYSGGFDAFRKGMPNDRSMGRDWNDGYETARFTRMASVAEGSSEGYNNPKGKKGLNPIKGAKKTGAKAKVKTVKEGAVDATVFDKDYHSPVKANGHWDMAQHKGEPHVQGRGQEEKVKVPNDLKKSLKEEITSLRTDAGKIRYRDEYRADFYENTAEAFETLLHHLEEGTVHSLLLAQIDMNRVMSPMTERLPRDVYMYIVRGGKPASLGELFREVKVNTNGADLSKTDYNK